MIDSMISTFKIIAKICIQNKNKYLIKYIYIIYCMLRGLPALIDCCDDE